MGKRKKRQAWDEHLVTAVLIVSAIAILILLASVMSSTGKASFSGTPTPEGVLSILNQNTVVIDDEGRMKCTFACAKEGKKAQVSYLNDQPVENDVIVNGQYTCSCVGIE